MMVRQARLADGTILQFPDDASDFVIEKTVKNFVSSQSTEVPKTPRKSLTDQVKEFTSGVWSQVNPINAIQALAHPYDTLRSIGPAQANVFEKAKDAWKKREYGHAVRSGINYLIPILGPAMDKAADAIMEGNTARGLGESVGIGMSMKGFKMPKKIPLLPKMSNVNPVEAAAVEFGQKAGIPIDAATATENQGIRGLQWLADRSIPGGYIAGRAKRAQADALAATGNRLAERVNASVNGPGPRYTPEQAGSAVRGSLETTIGKLKKEADVLYGKFREIEARPENLQMVEVKKPLPESIVVEGKRRKLSEFTPQQREALGYPDLEPEVVQMVQDATETRMGEMKDLFTSDLGKLSGKGKNIEGIEDMNYAAASDIKQGFGHISVKRAFPELEDLNEAPGRIAEAIEKDKGNKLFLKVKERAEQDVLSRFQNEINEANIQAKEQKAIAPAPVLPSFKPEIQLKEIALPVDMRPIKAAAKPLYEHMSKWMANALQNASSGYKALKSIMEGDDFIQASDAEAGLSGLKSLAREAPGPDLANVSQGIGKFNTRLLSKAIDKAVEKAGPEALRALHGGRAKHMAKMTVAEVTKNLREQPVQTLNQLVFAKDSNINLLRSVKKLAPREMVHVGRAYLEDMFSQATNEGGFGKAQSMWNRWQNLGPETKKIIFENEKLVKDLDNFFLLAKKIAENPNVSGSGYAASLGAQGGLLVTNPLAGIAVQIGAGTLSKMMHTPGAVRALTNGLRIPLSQKLASAVAASQILFFAGRNESSGGKPPIAYAKPKKLIPSSGKSAAAVSTGQFRLRQDMMDWQRRNQR